MAQLPLPVLLESHRRLLLAWSCSRQLGVPLDIRRTSGSGADVARRYRIGQWMAATALFLSLSACFPLEATASAECAGPAAPSAVDFDCSRIGAARDKEACLLALPETACRKLGKACFSLRDARAVEDRLTRLEKDIVSKARSRYASYTRDDPSYLDDLEKSFVSASSAWRTYRDAYCLAEPMIHCMARTEQAPLIAYCRANVTRERISQLEQLAGAIP